MNVEITPLSVQSLEDASVLAGLIDVLIDCVDGGASVGFLAPLTRQRAEQFWRSKQQALGDGSTVLLAAMTGKQVIGTVQLALAPQENQPHRAEVAKLLVQRHARGNGIGSALLRAIEQQAVLKQRRLLVLDTATGSDAEYLYQRHGWQHCGIIPDYALYPDGSLTATTFYSKRL